MDVAQSGFKKRKSPGKKTFVKLQAITKKSQLLKSKK
jgi:hypothetical protein